MTHYVQKQRPIEAIQWTGLNADPVIEFLGENAVGVVVTNMPLTVRNREQWFKVATGEWVIKNDAGEFRSMSDEVFKSTYEEMKDAE